MSWFRKLFGLDSQPGDEERRQTPQEMALSTKPPLVFLASDSGGLTALRLHRFQDAEAASEYIEFWHPERAGNTVYPFWALPTEPSEAWLAEGENRGESVVLIRDEAREGVVYPFSFSDLPTAWMFVREEITRGLEYDKISIYWAVPVEIVLDDEGSATVRPDAPPPISSRVIVADAADLVIETKTTFVPKEPVEEAGPLPTADNGEPTGPLPYPAARNGIEVHELKELTTPAEMPMNGTKADDGPPEVARNTNGGISHNEPPTPSETSTNGDRANAKGDERDVQPRGARNTNGGISHDKPPAPSETSTNGDRADEKGGERDVQPPSDKNETAYDPRKILRWRRLDRHDGPFKGFGSPPGRF